MVWEWPQSVVKGSQQEQREFLLWGGEGDSCISQYQSGYRQRQRPQPLRRGFPAFEGNICSFVREPEYSGADQHWHPQQWKCLFCREYCKYAVPDKPHPSSRYIRLYNIYGLLARNLRFVVSVAMFCPVPCQNPLSCVDFGLPRLSHTHFHGFRYEVFYQ